MTQNLTEIELKLLSKASNILNWAIVAARLYMTRKLYDV